MTTDPSHICFGLSTDLDQSSLSIFLQLAGKPEFTKLLANRLDSQEITGLVDNFMELIRKHLSEDEYHTVFLGDQSPHSHEE